MAWAQQVAITSVSPNPVCAGSIITVAYSSTLSSSGNVTLYLNSPDGTSASIGTASTNGGNGSVSGIIPAGRPTGSYTVRVSRSYGNSPTVDSPISGAFTVNALPAAPVVSNLAYCLGTTGVPPLTATGQNLKWYTTSAGGAGSATAPTPPASSAGTTNYYVSQSVNGCEGPRATLTVTINPLPVKPTVTSALSYCQNASVPSLAAAVSSGNNLKWYAGATGGTGSTAAPTPQTSTVTTTSYYVSQTDGNGCESDRATITVTIRATPNSPAVTTPVTYCQNQTAAPLSATPVTGGPLNWFGPSNNSLGSTAPTPPTNSPGTTFYTVSQTVNGCTSTAATITVTVNATPPAPATSPASACQGGATVSLVNSVTPLSGNTLKWYTSPTSASLAAAPQVATTSTGSQVFYVSQTNANGCESSRASITYTVYARPNPPTVQSPVTYCQNATALPLQATASPGGTLNFYGTNATGGTSTTQQTPQTQSSNIYYVSQTVNGCESSTRAPITVTINALPPKPIVTTPVAYCQFAVATILSATALTNNTLYWYGTNATGGTASSTAPTPPTNADGTFTYYVSQKDPIGCESERATISVTIYPKPAAPAVTPASACLNSIPNPLTQSVTATGILKWYTSATGGTGSTVAPTLSTSATGTTTYYVSQTNGSGCESDRSAITFTVNPLPAAPVPTPAKNPLIYCQNETAAPLTANGQNLKWYLAASGGNPLANPVIPSTAVAGPPITYYVSQTDGNGCESPRASVTVTTISRPAPPTVSAAPVTYCQYATATPLSATPITGNSLNWYGTNATGGTATSTATPTTDIADTKLYYVSQTDGNGCESSSRASITVKVNAKPTAPTVTTITLCQNATPVALATAVTSGTNLKWYTAQTGGTGSTVAPTLSTAAVGSTTYYVSQTSADGCESDRSAVVVTVKPLPVAPTLTLNTQNLCQSSVPTPLTAIATGTLKWYNASGPIPSPVTPSTTNVGPTTYFVSQIVDGCEGPKATLNVVVIPKPVAPTVTSSVTICQAATPITLAATGQNLKWYTDPTGGTPSATAPTPPTSASGTTVYYVTQTDANNCESDRAAISVRVKQKPAPPGTAALSVCSNQVTPLTATFAAGTTPNWYGTNATGGTASVTAPTPSTAVIGAPVQYYVSQTLEGCESDRASIAVTIKVLPVAPTVSSTPVTYCQDAVSVPLSATATGSLNWYTTQAGGTASSTAPTPSTNSSLPPTTYYYVSQTVDGCEGPRASIAVTINPRPAQPTVVSSFTYCQNATAQALTATGQNLKWYTALTGGTSLATAPTPPTTTPGSTIYYVSQTNANGCESDRASITVTIVATPDAPGVTSLSLCQSSTPISLTATASTNGALYWYGLNATGGTATTLAPTPPTATTGTTTYYVSQRVSGCEGPRAGLNVTIVPLPTAPAVAPTSVSYCQNAVATALVATAGGTLNWYISQGGVVSPLGQVSPIPSTTAVGTTTYLVSQSVNGCEGPRSTISVTTNALPPAPTVAYPANTLNLCQNSTASPLMATGSSGGVLNWYTVATGGTPITAPVTPNTSTTGTTIYYVSQVLNGCESARTTITVIITATPAAPGTTPASFCYNTVATALTATAVPGGILNWYTSATGGTASTAAPVPPTNVVGTTTYYVSQSVNGCESPRTSLDVTIKPLPVAPTVTTSAPSFCQNSVSTALSATPISGGTLNWYTVPTGGTASPTAPIPPTNVVGTTTYYVSQSVNGCEGSQASIVVTIKALPAAPTVSASSVTFCQGTTATALTAGFSPGGTLNWYTTPTGGISSPVAPVPSTATPGLTTYYVSQSVNGCESPLVPIVVIIKLTPSVPIVGASPIYCQGGTATALSATAPDGGSLNWYTNVTGGTPTTTPPVPPVSSLGVVTYYVSQILDGCESARVSLTATIKAAPAAPSATASVAYCQGSVAVPLTATPTGGDALNWYTTPTGGSPSAVAPVPATSSPGSTLYYVSQTDATGCESVRSAVTVKVNALPAAPSTVPATYCQGSVATALTATLNGGVSLNWYTAAAGGVGSPVAPTPVTTSSGTTPYYVSQTDANGCESNRNVVLVTVTPTPDAPVIASIAPVCQNSPAFAVQAAGQNLKWYSDPTSTASLGSSVLQSTAVPGTFVYYVSQTSNSCEGARAQVQVVVNPLPAAPVVTNQTGCQDVVAQPLTATGTNLQWYDANDNQISAPTPVTKVDLTQTYTYKVSQTLNGCTSPKATFTYTVNVTPLPTVTPVAAYCQNSVITPLQATGTNLKWTDPNGVVSANTPTPSTAAVTSGSSYFVTQTSSLGCESRPAEIKVTVNAQAVAKLDGNASVYLGSPALLTLTLTGAGPYSYTLSDGTVGIAETSANSPITTKQISVTPAATTTYTVAAVSNACGIGPSSGAATVTVKVPTITTTSLSALSVCAGTALSVNFSTTGEFVAGNAFSIEIASTTGDSLSRKYIPISNGVVQGSFITTTVPSSIAPGQYYVRVVASNAPYSIAGTINPAVLTIRPVATSSFSVNKMVIYKGESVILSFSLGGDGPWQGTYVAGTEYKYFVSTTSVYSATLTPATTTTYKSLSIANGCGNGKIEGADTVTVTVNILTAEEDPFANSVKVYPVPADGEVTVDIDIPLQSKPAELRLIGPGGRTTEQLTTKKRQTILDLSKEPAGTYLLHITVGDRSTVRKILKL
ncbi:Ig-like domain-containing protein [Spirosoma lituiforme]